MKKVFYVLVILIYSLSGCKDNKLTNPIIEEAGHFTSMTGTLLHWRLGKGYSILLVVTDGSIYNNSFKTLTATSIDTNGSFSLTNLSAPPDTFLKKVEYPTFGSDLTVKENTLKCSNLNAKTGYGSLSIVNDTTDMAVAGVYRLNFFHGDFYRKTELEKAGEFVTSFIYSNSDYSYTGRVKYEYGDPHISITTVLNYNLSYKVGWNSFVTCLVLRTIEQTADKMIVTEEYSFTNKEPGAADWYYITF